MPIYLSDFTGNIHKNAQIAKIHNLATKQQQLLDSQQYIIDYYVNNWEGEYFEEKANIVVDDKPVEQVRKFIEYKYNGNLFTIEMLDEYFTMVYGKKNK